jgi:hypothetical protein
MTVLTSVQAERIEYTLNRGFENSYIPSTRPTYSLDDFHPTRSRIPCFPESGVYCRTGTMWSCHLCILCSRSVPVVNLGVILLSRPKDREYSEVHTPRTTCLGWPDIRKTLEAVESVEYRLFGYLDRCLEQNKNKRKPSPVHN